MNKLLVIPILFLLGCVPSKLSNKTSKEQLQITTQSFDKPLTYLQATAALNTDTTRSLMSAELLFKGIDFAFDGIKTAIKKSAEKYYQQYVVSLYNNTFYAQNSRNGMLDPENIKFNGFSILRSIELKDGREVALQAYFTMDETKYIDIYTQSKFYLKCDSLVVNYAKVKLNDKKWYLPWTLFIKKQETINLDLEIDILANWMDENGGIHKQEPFGKFYLPVRNYTVGEADTAAFDVPVSGYSYLPPRSATYCLSSRGQWEKCFGQGDFDIVAKLTESSKNNKLNKIIYDNISVLEGVDAQPIKELLNK
jgi:hypothetical protein